jgi:hypothetical protein
MCEVCGRDENSGPHHPEEALSQRDAESRHIFEPSPDWITTAAEEAAEKFARDYYGPEMYSAQDMYILVRNTEARLTAIIAAAIEKAVSK